MSEEKREGFRQEVDALLERQRIEREGWKSDGDLPALMAAQHAQLADLARRVAGSDCVLVRAVDNGEAFDLALIEPTTRSKASKLVSSIASAAAHAAVHVARGGKELSCGHSGCILRVIGSEALRELRELDPEGSKHFIPDLGIIGLILDEDLGFDDEDPGPVTKH